MRVEIEDLRVEDERGKEVRNRDTMYDSSERGTSYHPIVLSGFSLPESQHLSCPAQA